VKTTRSEAWPGTRRAGEHSPEPDRERVFERRLRWADRLELEDVSEFGADTLFREACVERAPLVFARSGSWPTKAIRQAWPWWAVAGNVSRRSSRLGSYTPISKQAIYA